MYLGERNIPIVNLEIPCPREQNILTVIYDILYPVPLLQLLASEEEESNEAGVGEPHCPGQHTSPLEEKNNPTHLLTQR